MTVSQSLQLWLKTIQLTYATCPAHRNASRVEHTSSSLVAPCLLAKVDLPAASLLGWSHQRSPILSPEASGSERGFEFHVIRSLSSSSLAWAMSCPRSTADPRTCQTSLWSTTAQTHLAFKSTVYTTRSPKRQFREDVFKRKCVQMMVADINWLLLGGGGGGGAAAAVRTRASQKAHARTHARSHTPLLSTCVGQISHEVFIFIYFIFACADEPWCLSHLPPHDRYLLPALPSPPTPPEDRQQLAGSAVCYCLPACVCSAACTSDSSHETNEEEEGIKK